MPARYHHRMSRSRHPVLREAGAWGATRSVDLAGRLRAIRFAAIVVVTALSPSAWSSDARRLAARQIHFSAWQALPGFLLACAVLGFVLVRIVIGTAQAYGLASYALELTVRVLALELIPLFAALFVGVRSGATIGVEVALKHVDGEFERLARAGGDPLALELVPRAIGILVAVVLLTLANGALVLALAYVELYGLSPWAAGSFVRVTGQVFDPVIVAGFLMKTTLFGVAAGAIPIAAGLGIRGERAQVAGATGRGMVRLGTTLGLIEVVFLAVTYA